MIIQVYSHYCPLIFRANGMDIRVLYVVGDLALAPASTTVLSVFE
jgi:hypothetical protein